MQTVIIVIAFVFFILLLFTPIELIFSKHDKTSVKVRFWILSFNMPRFKAQSFNLADLKSSVKPLYLAIKYLLGKSSVTVREIVLLNVFDLAEKPYGNIARFIGASVILTILSEMAGEYKYLADRYIVTEENTKQAKLTVSVNFLLYRLIISLFLVAYYKIVSALKERVKYVRKQNE